MIKFAITGNIASGKSTVLEIINKKRLPIIDTDTIAHELLYLEEVKNTFRNHDVWDNGELSRPKLGQLIFNDINLKNKLENILFPKIKDKIIEFFNENAHQRMVFVAIPLVFEANMQNLFDKIICIYTDNDIRLKRLIERNNYSEEYAKLRMECQMPQEEKANKSDFVIYNNGSFDELELEITKIIE